MHDESSPSVKGVASWSTLDLRACTASGLFSAWNAWDLTCREGTFGRRVVECTCGLLFLVLRDVVWWYVLRLHLGAHQAEYVDRHAAHQPLALCIRTVRLG